MARGISAGFVGVAMLASLPAHALQFQFGDLFGSVTNFVTLGAEFRAEERDPELVGKINLQPGLCTRTNRTTNPDADETVYLEAQEGDIGGTCNSTSDPSLNQQYVDAPGSFNINGDNGNLNFDRGDVVSAAVKLNSELSINWLGFQLEVNGIWFFNDTLVGFDEFHPDTTLQRQHSPLPPDTVDQFGTHFEIEDFYISTFQTIFGQDFSFRLGRTGLNWGESTALVLNSINVINPPDQARQRTPGFDVFDELFASVGMFTVGTDISLNLSATAFYQYEWKPVRIDAPGTFFSVTDTLGGSNKGGQYAMLSFGKAPEDPLGIYAAEDNPQDPFQIASESSRTIYRLADREPEDGGQYGLSLRYFAENFNGGTEFAFYFANYHSRVPSVSVFAADETCAVDSRNAAEFAADCDAGQGDIGLLGFGQEPLPVDTVRLFAEYPEDIRMFGVSFNTTVGDWALSGEYSYRPNLPTQIHTVDLLFAALQPAFPRNNINIGPPQEVDPITGLPIADNAPRAVFPGRRIAVPDYVETIYRENEVQPGQYIRGFERLKQGQLTLTLLKTFGGDNLLKASQIIFIAEAGLTHVLDLPDLSDLQFQGGGTDTHISRGADGTINEGITDSAIATDARDTEGDGDFRCERMFFESVDKEAEPCRQNPTTQDPDGFGTEFSSGVRLIALIRYQDFFKGINFEPLLTLFYDVDGHGPGLGQNFQEDRIQSVLGLRFDYLSKWFWDVSYTYHDGDVNPIRDRDTFGFSLRYEF